MPSWLKTIIRIAKKTFSQFAADDCPRHAAALAYYTIFSLPPLIVMAMTIGGFFVAQEDVRGEVGRQMRDLIGKEGALQIELMVKHARQSEQGVFTTTAGIVMLLFGATGMGMQIQQVLNGIWEVEPDPDGNSLRNFALQRLLSMVLILVISFLLLVSLTLSAAISFIGNYMGDMLPEGVSTGLLIFMNEGVAFLVIAFLFASIFKVLPDVYVSYKDVAVGAIATAALFIVGKTCIGLYLGQKDMGSLYGAAGSLVLVLLWVYYSSMILCLGAEFTQVWACHRGKKTVPKRGAVLKPRPSREPATASR